MKLEMISKYPAVDLDRSLLRDFYRRSYPAFQPPENLNIWQK